MAVKQPHHRFDVDTIDMSVTPAQARRDLIGGSIKLSSSTTYDSRMRTLGRYLTKARNVPDSHPATCSENDFWLFLYHWKAQGMAPAAGVRSALLKEHTAMGGFFLQDGTFCHQLPSFLQKDDLMTATEASGANFVKLDKGVLDEVMIAQWEALVTNCEDSEIEAGSSCGTCLRTVSNLRRQMILAERLMLAAPLRPGDLKGLRFADLLILEPLQINVLDPKVTGRNRIPCGHAAVEIFAEARTLSSSEYVFPRCISKHLDRSLRLSEELFEWPFGLVFSPHCLRHTFMSGQRAKIADVVTGVISSISSSTFGTYARPNEERRSERWWTAVDTNGRLYKYTASGKSEHILEDWFYAIDVGTGKTYWYTASGLTSWVAPQL